MRTLDVDVVVVGGGFGGSLTALLLGQCGLKTAVLERDRHSRFAIGESSTPIANRIIERLARQYHLPRLLPLCHCGAWKEAYPDVACGCKRGFSYFHHESGRAFTPRADHANELLVAANVDQARADTQWFRADVDAFFADEVRRTGTPFLQRVVIESQCENCDGRNGDGTWHLSGDSDSGAWTIEARFLIDATGGTSAFSKSLGGSIDSTRFKTHSRAIFSHFAGVKPWADIHAESGGRAADHPFPMDDAALHHVFDGGWMWVLRFDNGITSAGFVVDVERFPQPDDLPPQREWARWIDRFPSIKAQFAQASPVQPIFRTSRLQRRAARAIGRNWAMLPAAAAFVDPLHSSGIAHNVLGIARLVEACEALDDRSRLGKLLATYEDRLFREVAAVDRLIHGCCRVMHRFDLFAAFSMLYFLGAIDCEEQLSEAASFDVPLPEAPVSEERVRPSDSPRTKPAKRALLSGGFLSLLDPRFDALLHASYDRLSHILALNDVAPGAAIELNNLLARKSQAFNQAGLCDLSKHNMYPYR
ncbi:MAG: NAD(P)/FAD-dependent oxidoreductase [Phycisphaerae bacterium]